MAGHAHGHALRNPGSDQVTNYGPSKIKQTMILGSVELEPILHAISSRDGGHDQVAAVDLEHPHLYHHRLPYPEYASSWLTG